MRKFMHTGNPNSRPVTAFDRLCESAGPLSNEDKKRLADEWAKNTLKHLMAYANVERSFSYFLCQKVVENFSSDDELSKLMLQLSKDARKGKPRGPRKTWTKSRYLKMLVHYEIGRAVSGRKAALEWTAHNEGIGINGQQDCNIKKVEEKITEARKKVPEWREHIPPIFLKDSERAPS